MNEHLHVPGDRTVVERKSVTTDQRKRDADDDKYGKDAVATNYVSSRQITMYFVTLLVFCFLIYEYAFI